MVLLSAKDRNDFLLAVLKCPGPPLIGSRMLQTDPAFALCAENSP